MSQKKLAKGRRNPCAPNGNPPSSNFWPACCIEPLESRQLLAIDALDPTFSDNGATRFGFAKTHSFLRDMVVSSDGRVFLAGQAAGGGGWAGIAALLPDGRLDTSFANQGRIVYPEQNVPSEYLAVAVRPDGSIVAAGEHSINPDGVISFDYYHSDGRFWFSTAVPHSAGLYDRAFAIALQPTPVGAKLVAAGIYNNHIAVFRELPNGLPDTTFSGDGIATTTVSGYGYALALQGDKTLAAGFGYPDSSTGKHPIVVRLTSSGDLDSTFGAAGQADLFSTIRNVLPAGEGEIKSIALQPDGKFVVAGKTGANYPGTIFVARLTADGAIDTSFSSDGLVLLGDVNYIEVGPDVVVEDDGSILYSYTNYSSIGPDPYIPIVGRLTEAGEPDPRFGANGVFRLINAPEAYPKNAVGKLALQDDGKALVSGYTCNDSGCNVYVIRLDGGFPGTALLENGVLKITGTTHDDSVQVLNTFDGFMDVNINGQLAGHFPLAQVQSIQADLLDGNDLFTLEQASLGLLTFNGNNGHDSLTISSGQFTLFASNLEDLTLEGDAHVTQAFPLHLSTLNLGGTSTLDVQRFGLILDSADLGSVDSLIRSNRIVSFLNSSGFRLAAIVNSDGAGGALYSSFEGISGLSGNEVLVLYTLLGDLNLDRTVSIADFIDLSAHFNKSPATWRDGDLNDDQMVSIADFIDLSANFGRSFFPPAAPQPALASATAANDHSRSIRHHMRHRRHPQVTHQLLKMRWPRTGC